MTFSNVAGVLMDLDGLDNSFAYLHGGGTRGGDITLDGATLTVTPGTGAANFGGVISGAGGGGRNGASVQRPSGWDSSKPVKGRNRGVEGKRETGRGELGGGWN